MTTDKRLDESITRWLEETAAKEIPGHVLDATFELTRGSRQHVGWRGLLGRSRMTQFAPVLGGAAVVVAVVAVLAFWVTRWSTGRGRADHHARSAERLPRHLGQHQ